MKMTRDSVPYMSLSIIVPCDHHSAQGRARYKYKWPRIIGYYLAKKTGGKNKGKDEEEISTRWLTPDKWSRAHMVGPRVATALLDEAVLFYELYIVSRVLCK